MRILVNPLQATLAHVGVNAGGRQLGMAQKHLHAPQIRSTIEEMGGEGVAQRVWTAVNCRLLDMFLDRVADPAIGESAPAMIEK